MVPITAACLIASPARYLEIVLREVASSCRGHASLRNAIRTSSLASDGTHVAGLDAEKLIFVLVVQVERRRERGYAGHPRRRRTRARRTQDTHDLERLTADL